LTGTLAAVGTAAHARNQSPLLDRADRTHSSECNHLHRLPAAAGISEQGRDIFGRDKHGDYRDDMGGVGSLQRVNRTLYVGRIIEEADSFSRPQSAGGGGANMPAGGGGWAGGKVLQQAKASSGAGGKLRKEGKEQMSGTERVLRRHFSEWGEIQRSEWQRGCAARRHAHLPPVKVLHTRSCAFVTYVHEAQAQFAKEAMSNQSLDHDEVLNVRWATDDPNEGAQKRDRDERESEGRAAIERNLTDEQRAAGAAVRALEMAELEEESDAKRRRLEEEAYAKLVEENERNWAEMEAQEMLRLQAEEEAALQQQTSRFVSREALGGLLALRKEPPPPAPKQSALGGLAAYGSDSEEE
jgi:hypothetical protein